MRFLLLGYGLTFPKEKGYFVSSKSSSHSTESFQRDHPDMLVVRQEPMAMEIFKSFQTLALSFLIFVALFFAISGGFIIAQRYSKFIGYALIAATCLGAFLLL
jgi:hypothetical protein